MTNEIEDKVKELMDLLEKEYNWKFNSEEKKNTPKRVKNMLDE